MTITEPFEPIVGPPRQELGSTPPAPPPFDADDDKTPPDLADLVPEVTEPMVRGILAGIGNMASMIDRAAPGLWRFTDDELDQLAPPVTRLANRNDTLRRALLHGDYVVIAMTLSGYAVRNISTRKESVDARNRLREGHGPARQPGAGSPFGIVDGGQPHAGNARWGTPDAEGSN